MGILRGYDVYLNVVLDEALEEKPNGEKVRIGMVVIRGNSVVMIEVRIPGTTIIAEEDTLTLRARLWIALSTRNRGSGGRPPERLLGTGKSVSGRLITQAATGVRGQ